MSTCRVFSCVVGRGCLLWPVCCLGKTPLAIALLHSLVAQTVKRLPAMWKTRVRPLVREDPLEKEMAIHSSTLAWKIPWTEEPGGLQSMGLQRVGHDWATYSCFILYFKGKFACYSRCFLTSYFCIPVPYTEKDIFFGVSSKRSCRSS